MTAVPRYAVTPRLMAVVACLVLCGCGGEPAPTAPTPLPTPAPALRFGILDGTVHWEANNVRIGQPLLGGAKVEAQSHTGEVFSTTSDDRGYYRLDVPEGTAVVRASRPGYVAVRSGVTIEGGYRINLTLLLQRGSVPTPAAGEEWVIEGTVTDTRGAPIPGVVVSARHLGTDIGYASLGTNAAGRYRLVTRATRMPSDNILQFQRSGYVTGRIPIDCRPLHTTVDVRLRGIAQVTLRGPESLLVAEAAPIVAVVTFDDGVIRELSPGGVRVAAAGRSAGGRPLRNSPRGPGWVEGVRPGVGALSWSYYGVTAVLRIRVEP